MKKRVSTERGTELIEQTLTLRTKGGHFDPLLTQKPKKLEQ